MPPESSWPTPARRSRTRAANPGRTALVLSPGEVSIDGAPADCFTCLLTSHRTRCAAEATSFPLAGRNRTRQFHATVFGIISGADTTSGGLIFPGAFATVTMFLTVMNRMISRTFEKYRNTRRSHGSRIVFLVVMTIFSGVTLHPRADLAVSAEPPARVDERRLFALGMIESGNDDRGVGAAGEISRYQIQPSVWKTYSVSRRYQEPDIARSVACQHWQHLAEYFHQKTGREPSDFDMYVLWNTRFGYYASRSFDPRLIHLSVRDRASRFVNLVNR
jgi:hypothetical protein